MEESVVFLTRKVFFLGLSTLFLKGSVREKEKGVEAQCDKKALLIAANLTSICCVYKEKIEKTSHTEERSAHTN